jgi:two-component system sensor histidine kinase SenX3
VALVVAVVAFLLGAAASAFAAALFVRRSTTRAGTSPTAPPVPGAGLASRALGALDVGVVVLDRDETAIFANPVARRMGVVEADRLTLPVLSELVRSVTDSGQADSVTLDLTTPGRGPDHVSFLVRAMPLRDGGRVGSVVLRFSDITEARRLELVRRDFVANVSHELKTPVGALNLLAEAVQEAADDPEAVTRFAGRMQTESARLTKLVQQIIELSRLQADDPLGDPEPVDVDAVITRSIDQSTIDAQSKGISVVHDGQRGLSVLGNGDEVALALGNLVANAVAYSPERSRVVVAARAHDMVVDLTVTDQGIGIPAAEIDRIFERFYRIDPARHRSTGGTGLGLSIVKHVAASHGGEVRVWSVEGQGSTFTLSLPRRAVDGPVVAPVDGPVVAPAPGPRTAGIPPYPRGANVPPRTQQEATP